MTYILKPTIQDESCFIGGIVICAKLELARGPAPCTGVAGVRVRQDHILDQYPVDVKRDRIGPFFQDIFPRTSR